MEGKLSKLFKSSDAMIAFGLIAILGVMVVPLPPFMLDLALALQLATSLVLLLTSVYAGRSLEFSIFPSLLLVTTLFRLAVNIATTRSILLKGGEVGTDAAGNIIHAFGEFIVGGNYAVGIVVFTILVIINFIVITKGAGRVAEVAARFTLDAMPGKQMAIDADLNAGMINETEARRRRQEIAQEADFYGAMDGASKFVRGDAIAGILICLVNIIGGIIIGTLQNGMDFSSAAQTFTLLTVGDGLVSQIPALIISTAAGIIVTRTASGKNLAEEFSRQLVMQPKAIGAASGVMGMIALMPGLPAIPFLTISGALGALYFNVEKKKKEDAKAEVQKKEEEKLKPKKENLESLLPVDILELEVGYGLINVVDAEQNGDLLERISNIRKQFALDMGMIIPPLRIRDNLELQPGDYQIMLKGVSVASGSLMVGHLMAMNPGNVTEEIPGIQTTEPAFGLDALWISPTQKESATLAGYTVVDLSTVMATHLTEVIRSNAYELLGRQELQTLLDHLKENSPKVVEDLIPQQLSLGTVLRVLKNLLRESVSIRDLRSILEILADHVSVSKDAQILTEYVRTGLARNITKKYVNDTSELSLLTLDRTIEETIAQGIIQTDQGAQLSVDPDFVRKLVGELNQQASDMMNLESQAIVLCSPVIRSHLKQLIDRFIPNIVVLSHNEITPNVKVKSFGTVRLSHAG